MTEDSERHHNQDEDRQPIRIPISPLSPARSRDRSGEGPIERLDESIILENLNAGGKELGSGIRKTTEISLESGRDYGTGPRSPVSHEVQVGFDWT